MPTEIEAMMSADNRNREGAAIFMRQYGGPDVLQLETVLFAALRPDEIRIRSIASAVNHSDLEIRAGNWPILRPNPFPYIPGIEAVGEVVEIGADVSEFRIGDRVITMMQGLGGVRAQRPGAYAAYVVVQATAAAAVAEDVDPLDMAALGLASVTAFEGLRRIGNLNPHCRHQCRWWRWVGRGFNSEGSRILLSHLVSSRRRDPVRLQCYRADDRQRQQDSIGPPSNAYRAIIFRWCSC
jgi:NADPH:quinone reductase-like Zn-dependent oxidoreductase